MFCPPEEQDKEIRCAYPRCEFVSFTRFDRLKHRMEVHDQAAHCPLCDTFLAQNLYSFHRQANCDNYVAKTLFDEANEKLQVARFKPAVH